MKQENTTQLGTRPLNYKQLAAIYEVTHKTLKSWLEPFMEEIGQMRGRSFTVRQVQTILDKLGIPKSTPT